MKGKLREEKEFGTKPNSGFLTWKMPGRHRSSSVPMTSIGERIQLEQSEMIRILRLQRAHQNLKGRKLA
jgi:hypothetical protein